MKAEELRSFRQGREESQNQFWSRFGVTQSCGSRFEQGAKIPQPVAILIALYMKGLVSDSDLGQDQGKITGPRALPSHLSM